MVLAYIDLAIVFHCLVFSIFFFFRKGGVGRSNILLGILLITVSFISIPFALKPTGWLFRFPLVDMEWPAGFLFGPVYFWLVREMTGEKIRFNKKELLLTVPAILALLYFSKFYFLSHEKQLAYMELIRFTYILDYQIGDAIFYPYIQIFLIYIIIALKRKKKKLSGVLLNNCQWLIKYTTLLVGFGFLSGLAFVLGLPQVYINAIPLISASIYLVLIYHFLQQSGLQFELAANGEALQLKPKYSGSNLNEEEAEKLNADLQQMMQDDKLFLNPDLTLQLLADELQSTPHHLSRVINQFHGKNFSDFINTYRIHEAKKLILIKEALKLEAIGYECGFNTKTTFNAAFKKVTGSTPSAFRKKHLEKDVQIYKS
ncbi:hypothetical protein BCY91_12510 [Pelobium manganitolerans]|uniref:HTH araC/xylS-type domain-containing protein n=1 Tax=Pelobium manganitolerans TaxID=1842495 RepID=A0A419S1W1_9SPHI|nr:helix-turn-helix domain-containing protein [Pelobium manganitolerans]RKD12460.1 hypothetical protein BCY91_12510 [Pelobium manganitolerans]